ncbi:sporulation protein YqfC [Cohnella sp. LGH]|uniref:Sporulation protein YqfC n=1 Tax=Cohnella phaseoli TaxID=456490 RepID=A0A3D9IRV3_9BACL|nr:MULTISPECIES: sporulation protein YqfC [Cohnella]QTH46147.1 sporulation protein YqfC [Cohnella sp. LGH]RED64249.1 sporulation protein YqfC [Cohnella phaseoli]
MMRVSRKLRKWTATILDLPQDVALDLPRITMIGGLQLTVENHRGILHFSPDTLRLAMDGGEMEITGQDLVIRNIRAEEVFVEGRILGVQLHVKGKPSG